MSLTVDGGVCALTPDMNKANPMANKLRLRTREINAVVMLLPMDKKDDLNRVPAEHIAGTFQIKKARLERRHSLIQNGLGRPTLAAMNRSQRTRLTHQKYFIVANCKDLTIDMGRVITRQGHSQGRYFCGRHLLDSIHTGLLFWRVGRD
jgi:hypothetical protein